MQTIRLDICRYQVSEGICVKQGDVGRKFQVKITDCGEDYAIPTGAKLSVWYSGTSGEGNYSEINGVSAFQVEGNTVTVEMIAQMMMNKGGGTLCLIIHRADGGQLGMWSIPYLVEGVPGMNSAAAENYYTALSETAAKALDSAMRAETAAGYFEESVLPVEHGGTGADTAEGAIQALGAMKSTLVHEVYVIEQNGPTLDETLKEIFDNKVKGTNKVIQVKRGAGIDYNDLEQFSLGYGSDWMILMTKSSSKYGAMIAWQYGEEYTLIKTRSVYKGVWSVWENHTPNLVDYSWEKLWENADPIKTKFTKQVIQNSKFSKYKTLWVLWRHSNNYGYTGYEPVYSGMAVRIYPAATLGTNNIPETFRYFNRTDIDKISFQSGYKNGSVDESACIPVAIYGVRY